MADVAGDEASRLRREREEAMERMLLAGEQQEEHNNNDAHDNAVANVNQAMAQGENDDNNDNNNNGINNDNNNQEAQPNNDDNNNNIPAIHPAVNPTSKRLSYTTTSFLLALGTVWYAMRTREQWYLALVFLGSSKVAYCVLGNAMVATAIVIFDATTRFFLGGLRVMEAEGLQDFFRWNVTETCLALTMFRQELTIRVAIQFLILVLMKCIHHVATLREQHLRMTDDAVRGSSWNPHLPVVPLHHCKVLVMLVVLQSLDLLAVQYMGQNLLNTGPSVSILFAFESAILLVSAWSSILLWYIHVTDGLLNFWHDEHYRIGQRLLHPWKEYKATLTFAVELQAQAVQFLFYLAFFGFVMTYYGMPINLFREVYVSFTALKERLLAFLKYRRLMASMNDFETPTEEQLDEAGRVCIICRDEMTLNDCKALPSCQHMFHKSCLREWLVMQQSCPVCRVPVSQHGNTRQNAAQAAAMRRREEAPNEVDEQPEEDQANTPAGGAPPLSRPGLDTDPSAQARASDNDNGDDDTTNASNHDSGEDDSSSDDGSSQNSLPDHIAHTLAKKNLKFQGNKTKPLLKFPALYRVVRDRGAEVWDLESIPPRVLRRLPLGVVVFGTDMQEHLVEGEATDCVKIPDGWVMDQSVLRVYEVPSETSATESIPAFTF